MVKYICLQITNGINNIIQLSFVYSSFNVHMIIGIVLESVLMVVLLYVPGVNAVFGGR